MKVNAQLLLGADRSRLPQGSASLQDLLCQCVSCPHAKAPSLIYLVLSSCKDKVNGKKECHKFRDSESNPVDFPYADHLLIEMGIATA